MMVREEPVRVMVFSASLGGGGAERFTSNLLRHFDRERFSPEACLLRRDMRYAVPADVPIYFLDERRPWQILNTVRKLRNLIRKRRPELLISTIGELNLRCGAAIAGLNNRPRWIARVGGNPEVTEGCIKRRLAAKYYPLADLIVANGRQLANSVASQYPFIADRLRVIVNAVDLEYIQRQASALDAIERVEHTPVVVTVASLRRAKRIDILLAAMARIRQTVPAELWICGEGKLRRQLEDETERLGISNHVKWLGFQQNPFAIMARADLFALTSDHEGLPNALLEAQALGIPAVSTRCPFGPAEVIEHQRTGLLVPPGDVPAIAEAILKLLRDPSLRQAYGAAAKESIQNRFAIKPIIDQWQSAGWELARPPNRSSLTDAT